MRRRPSLFMPLMFLLIMYFIYSGMSGNRGTELKRTEFETMVAGETLKDVMIIPNAETPTGKITFSTEKGQYYINTIDVAEDRHLLEEKGVAYTVSSVVRENRFTTIVMPILTGIMLLGLILLMIFNQAAAGGGGGNNKMANFGKSRAKKDDGKNPTTFDDVAGLHEEKEDFAEIVDFLKSPEKYIRLGARIPKGVLLEGPPGTGKTMLAKAVAGEAGVPFFSISGSDFVEMFVGVGASRVRDLFKEAKDNSPCIVFIDEIDAVARRRGTGMGGGHDEREQTLNQLLVEMDGFGVNEGIIVLAATNRVDILDPAILRPGRFDRKIGVGRPDVRGREEILKVHSRKKPLGDDVDLAALARQTSGFSGADLENLLNEAAIHAAKEDRPYITRKDIEDSFIKVGIGTEKKSRQVNERERRITAYHESGHAILFHVLPGVGPVHTVSIIPTGMGAAGYTMPCPSESEMFRTKGQMLNDVCVSLGGRIAEDIIFGDVTTGASQDIKDATSTVRRMVTKYGMSDKLGMIAYGDDDDNVFIGRDLAHTKSYSEAVAAEIDAEVKRIMDECYAKAYAIVLAHRDVLEASAKLLLEKEKIGQAEFEALFTTDGQTEKLPEEAMDVNKMAEI